MSRTRLVLAVVGLLLVAGAIAAVGPLGDRGATEAEQASGRADADAGPPRQAQQHSQTLFIRRRGGVPAVWEERLRSVRGVIAVTRTGRAQALLRRSTRRGGATVDAPPSGYAVPLDALVVRPRSYAQVLPAEARPALRRLRPGTALLSRTSARLRRIAAGGRLTLSDGRKLRIVGVVDDELVRTAELVVGPRDAGVGGLRAAQLVVRTREPRRVRAALAGARATRIRSFASATRRSRGGIARPAELKSRFGEFAARLPFGEDWIGIEPRWLRRNVVTRSVPILGSVTCNRAFIAPLRRALTDLERRGLGGLVDRGDYAGCYAPRRIPGSGSLSLHAWGLAIDLNAARNPQFGRSRHDPRLIRTMERAGFTWGGRWPTAPDPMHFELQAPPKR